MTTIQSGSFNVSAFQKLGLQTSVKKLSEEDIARMRKAMEMLHAKPSNLDELKNHVSQKIYAEVKVNGQTVATLYNGGASMTSNAAAGKIRNLPSMGEEEKATGPELAQKRAEEIAKALGGTVVKAPTAVTQAQYLSTPAFQPEYEIDYDALNAALGQVATPQTRLDAQILGREEPSASTSAKDKFLAFQSMSWEEKVRAMILSSMGLEEEDLASMSDEEREKIEAKIKEKIEEEIEKKTGMKPATTGLVSASL